MHDDITYAINGGIFKVYNELANIWPEDTYETALEWELQSRGLTVERQKEYDVCYFGKSVGHYRLDLLVEQQVAIQVIVWRKVLWNL